MTASTSVLNNIPEKFTVEQAFTISMIFFYEIWPLVEPKVLQEEFSTDGMYSLFFTIVCTGEECSAEWNESVYRVTGVTKEEQKHLKLSTTDIFSCALAFVQLYNQRYKFQISYAVLLLENMQNNPNEYSAEWQVWHRAIKQTILQYLNSKLFDWSARLPEDNN